MANLFKIPINSKVLDTKQENISDLQVDSTRSIGSATVPQEEPNSTSDAMEEPAITEEDRKFDTRNYYLFY